MEKDKELCPDFHMVQMLQHARALIENFGMARGEVVGSLFEEFPAPEAKRIRRAVLNLQALTCAYERKYESPYIWPHPRPFGH